MITIEHEARIRRGKFRYDKRLFQHEDFADIVRRGWDKQRVDRDKFSPRIATCRMVMARWKKRHKTNAVEKIQELRNQIDRAMRDHTHPTSDIHRLKKHFNKAYIDEEQFWKQKSQKHLATSWGLHHKIFSCCH